MEILVPSDDSVGIANWASMARAGEQCCVSRGTRSLEECVAQLIPSTSKQAVFRFAVTNGVGSVYRPVCVGDMFCCAG
jgi:hypothetical protein